MIANNDFNLAITEDGELYSWGYNFNGQLGLGNHDIQTRPQLVDFFGDQYVDEIFCGNACTFAIIDDRLYSWGGNYHGQLGLGHNVNQYRPQLVDFFCDKIVVKIICGFFHIFAITRDNAIYSWGDNGDGQLGLGHDVHQNQPQLVDFFCDKIVDKIICCDYHTYAVVNNGCLYSWGDNEYGQLGLGNNADQNLPQLVDFFHDKIIHQIIYDNNHIFAITEDGTVYSWGNNLYGQLGLGNNAHQNRPRLVDFFHDKIVEKIFCSDNHVFAIMNDGSLYSWGANSYGQLGLGNNIHQNRPYLVDSLQGKTVDNIVCSYRCTYAMMSDGHLYSWGHNCYGQLGLGHNNNQNLPQLVDFFQDKNVNKIICGDYHIFAIIDDETVYSWGNNDYGQLGLGNNNEQNSPQLMDFFQEKNIRQARRINRVKSANSRHNI